MKKAIGIDLGTTSISGVVLDLDKTCVLEKRTIAGGHFLETGNLWEKMQDAEEIVQKAVQVIGEFLELHPDVEAIGVDCQMHGMLYVDQEGNPLSPLYTWQDARGEQKNESGRSAVRVIQEKTGEKTASGYGLVTHYYNTQHNLVPESANRICTIGDFLVMRLTGKKSPVMHVSNAASFGFFDCKKGSFRMEKLQMLGIVPSILPEVLWDILPAGEYKGRMVYMAIGDNQASFLGSVGKNKEKVLLNIGTGSQVSVLTDTYVEIPGMDTRPILKEQWLLVGASLCGGRAYALLEQFFRSYVCAEQTVKKESERVCPPETIEKQYMVMEYLAQQALEQRQNTDIGNQAERMEGDVLQVTPLFAGTREDPKLRGSIVGIGTENFTPGELILGTMKGMIQELLDLYTAIKAHTDSSVSELILSGNGIRRNVILQKLAEEMFELSAVLCELEEEAACGAALSTIVSR